MTSSKSFKFKFSRKNNFLSVQFCPIVNLVLTLTVEEAAAAVVVESETAVLDVSAAAAVAAVDVDADVGGRDSCLITLSSSFLTAKWIAANSGNRSS